MLVPRKPKPAASFSLPQRYLLFHSTMNRSKNHSHLLAKIDKFQLSFLFIFAYFFQLPLIFICFSNKKAQKRTRCAPHTSHLPAAPPAPAKAARPAHAAAEIAPFKKAAPLCRAKNRRRILRRSRSPAFLPLLCRAQYGITKLKNRQPFSVYASCTVYSSVYALAASMLSGFS